MQVNTKFDVICAGTAGIDILVKGLNLSSGLENEMTPAGDIQISTGGDPLNESTIIAKLGKKVGFCSKVGADVPGRLILDICRENNIDTSLVAVDANCASSSTIVFVAEDGERKFTSNMFNANNVAANFNADDIDYEAIKGVKVFSFGSLFINPQMDADNLEKMFKKVKEGGSLICCDMVTAVGPDGMKNISNALQYVDFIFPNFDEGAYFSGADDIDGICDYFLNLGVKNVVLKLGKKGSVIKNKSEKIEIPAFLAKAVDTTGAGDSFAGGFICALTEDLPLKECGRMGSAVSSLVVQAVGSHAGLKNRQQVEEILKA